MNSRLLTKELPQSIDEINKGNANSYIDTSYEYTWLGVALLENKPDYVAKLLEMGADPNQKISKDGSWLKYEPLHYAVYKNMSEMAFLLVRYGANISSKVEYGLFTLASREFASYYGMNKTLAAIDAALLVKEGMRHLADHNTEEMIKCFVKSDRLYKPTTVGQNVARRMVENVFNRGTKPAIFLAISNWFIKELSDKGSANKWLRQATYLHYDIDTYCQYAENLLANDLFTAAANQLYLALDVDGDHAKVNEGIARLKANPRIAGDDAYRIAKMLQSNPIHLNHALDWFEIALAKDYKDALKDTADTHMRLRQIPEAIAYYEKNNLYFPETASNELAAIAADDTLQAETMRQIGNVYLHGDSALRNTTKALEWYKKACREGSVNALLDQAQFYLTEMDRSQAIHFCFLAKLAGNEEAADLFNTFTPDEIYQYARQCEKNADFQERQAIIELYENAANNKHAKAMYRLAQKYETGNLVDMNIIIAFCLYQRALTHGYLPAQQEIMRFKVGPIINASDAKILSEEYETGRNIKRNIVEAKAWADIAEQRTTLYEKSMSTIRHAYNVVENSDTALKLSQSLTSVQSIKSKAGALYRSALGLFSSAERSEKNLAASADDVYLETIAQDQPSASIRKLG